MSLHLWSVIGILAASPVMALVLLLRSAPYGRHNRTGWGPCLKARTAWIVMELPAVAVFGWVGVLRGLPRGLPLLFLGLWMAHYLYRTFLYPALMRSSPRTVPLVLVLLGFLFNTANSFANGWEVLRTSPAVAGGWSGWLRVAAGLALFTAGFALHVWADTHLRSLRSRGDTGYHLPRAGLFRHVSAPNYLGELAQWCGWALATWSVAGLAFALFTAANLVPRALSHRAWYRARFPDYPPGTKAIVPGIL